MENAMPNESHTIAAPVANQSKTGRENQLLVVRTLDQHRKSFFPPLPNLPQRRMAQKHIRRELEKGFEFRLHKLSLELDTALHQIREESNHTLITGKAHLRKERMEFFANSYQAVVERFNELIDRFLVKLDARFERLERYKSRAIREREEQRLNKSADDFLSTLDQLIDDYRSIISEQVDHEQP
jgi:hypothetical protein